MTQETYLLLENYMRSCVRDRAHDENHVLRVLYYALELSQGEKVDEDVLIAACLLHDVGRGEEMANATLRHAAVGAEKAQRFLLENGFEEAFAQKVADCIAVHSYAPGMQRPLLEQRIMYDADKLDAAGALGAARTLLFHGELGEPLYALDENGCVLTGEKEGRGSFFAQYHGMLKNLPAILLTPQAQALARQRAAACDAFYQSAYEEAAACHAKGGKYLQKALNIKKN